MNEKEFEKAINELNERTSFITSLMYYSKPSEKRNLHKQKVKRRMKEDLKKRNKIREY